MIVNSTSPGVNDLLNRLRHTLQTALLADKAAISSLAVALTRGSTTDETAYSPPSLPLATLSSIGHQHLDTIKSLLCTNFPNIVLDSMCRQGSETPAESATHLTLDDDLCTRLLQPSSPSLKFMAYVVLLHDLAHAMSLAVGFQPRLMTSRPLQGRVYPAAFTASLSNMWQDEGFLFELAIFGGAIGVLFDDVAHPGILHSDGRVAYGHIKHLLLTKPNGVTYRIDEETISTHLHPLSLKCFDDSILELIPLPILFLGQTCSALNGSHWSKGHRHENPTTYAEDMSLPSPTTITSNLSDDTSDTEDALNRVPEFSMIPHWGQPQRRLDGRLGNGSEDICSWDMYAI